MTYIHVQPATSRNAQRLAGELQRVIDEHKRDNPGLSKTDIHQALRLAAMGAGVDRRKQIGVAIGVALTLLFGLLAFYMVQRG